MTTKILMLTSLRQKNVEDKVREMELTFPDYEIDVAITAEEARELASQNDYDLSLVEPFLFLSDPDRYSKSKNTVLPLIKELKEKGIPVVIQTASVIPPAEIAHTYGIKEGSDFDAYISMAHDAKDLGIIVDRVLGSN